MNTLTAEKSTRVDSKNQQVIDLKNQIKAIKQDENDKKLNDFLKNSVIAKALRIDSIKATNKALNTSNETRLLNTINLSKLVSEHEIHFNSEDFQNELKIQGIKLIKKEYIENQLLMSKAWYYKLIELSKVSQSDIDQFFASKPDVMDYNSLIKFAKNNGNTDGEGEGEGKEKTKYTFVATLKTDKNISIRIDDKGNIKGDSADILRMIKFLQDSIEQ